MRCGGCHRITIHADSLAEQVEIVAQRSWKRHPAGLDDFFAQEFLCKIGHHVGAYLHGAFRGMELPASIGTAADQVAGNSTPLDGDVRLGCGDGPLGSERDFKHRVVIRGEPTTDMVDPDRDEDAAVGSGGDFRPVGAVVSAGKRVFGGLFRALGPAAEAFAEGVRVDAHISRGGVHGEADGG